ncbi:SbcC/MukB-like Walker B domain-containing protein [Kribbella sp. NPDC051718]|uniref:ATP-binding protein n=1 Tax=Kribbella sp. NPDC051718 TaxID=3155168 RepID=UPI00341B4394
MLTEGATRWKAESLQMVNWGGFQGRTETRYSLTGSTLISGASGTGKSTMLDAYLALMMPSDTPFNGASNDAGGRARSVEQRNLVTYLRGKTDTSSVDGSDELRDQVLRGRDGGPVWGALGMTFVNTNGRKYTVMRVYYVKAGARLNGEVATTFAALDGYLDLSRLEPLAATRFDKRSMRAAFASIILFDTFAQFEQNLYTRLGIGPNGGEGRKALRLLARVQAGMQVKRVDNLYKSMVLEEPITYAAADKATRHFADIEASYMKMVDEAEKVKALRRLPDLQKELADGESEGEMIRQFGADLDGPSPFRLWSLRKERDLLDGAVVANRHEHAEVTTRHSQARTNEVSYGERLRQIAGEKRANGGSAIDERTQRIAALQRSRHGVYEANIRFQTRTEPIGLVVPETVDEFVLAQVAAADFLSGFEERQRGLNIEANGLREEQLAPLTEQQRSLLGERGSLQGRAGMVPRPLHEARVGMAEAAGLDPMNDLPFVAELIDVRPDEEPWRRAIETTLGGLARVILVDRNTRDHLSRSIDGVRIRPRIQFQAVTLADHEDWSGEPEYVSGKLLFKESPFSRWVQGRVSDDGNDHLCVPDSGSLTGPGARVTPSGQTRNGDRGAHGESGEGNIIGFSNKRRLADIEELLAVLDPQIETVRKRIEDVERRLADLRRQRDATRYVQDVTWESIDYLGIDKQVEDLEEEIRRLRDANQILDALQGEEERLKPLHAAANKERILTEERLEKLGKQHGDLASDQDVVQDGIDNIVANQIADVSPGQQAYLDTLYATHWGDTDPELFRRRHVTQMKTRLREDLGKVQASIKKVTDSMESMFENYKARWVEHNLGTSVASADGYREILDRIQAEGLHERRDKWRRELAKWSSDDLLELNDAFETAIEDIEARLEPVNEILFTLPFGGKGHLQINLRRLPSEEVTKFRRTLRALSSGIALETTDEQVGARFKQLRAFMTDISVPEGHTKSSTSKRDRLLDVRQHVYITAVCLNDRGNEVATYDTLGSKSGGETQELVAFIVGSALRYQLGDETRSWPRFAPVFLDEGFVKSDSEFAGRSVKAWQDLGFQLIIGAPLDKVTALEPHMDLILTVTKNSKGYSYITDLPDGAQ